MSTFKLINFVTVGVNKICQIKSSRKEFLPSQSIAIFFSSHFRNKPGTLSDNLNSCAVSYYGLIPSNLHFDFSFYTSKTEPVCIRLQLSIKTATQSILQVQQNG